MSANIRISTGIAITSMPLSSLSMFIQIDSRSSDERFLFDMKSFELTFPLDLWPNVAFRGHFHFLENERDMNGKYLVCVDNGIIDLIILVNVSFESRCLHLLSPFIAVRMIMQPVKRIFILAIVYS